MLREQLLSKTEIVNVPIDLSTPEEILNYGKEVTRGNPNPVEV